MITMAQIRLRILKALHNEQDDHRKKSDDIYRAGSLFSSKTANLYTEEVPHVANWIKERIHTFPHILNYIRSLFPFIHWIQNYNYTWLLADLIAGITVGIVVIPQGMAYSVLANLPPQYGLYTSFIGVLIYWLFATSKDVTIGPVAILSALIGDTVSEAKISHPDIPGPVIASALSLICGLIILFTGLVRCGWIINMIPLVSIVAFTTGSAITISIGQIPGLLGIKNLHNSDSSFQLMISILKNLRETKLDAALGLSSIFLLYLSRSLCNLAKRKLSSQEKYIFLFSTLHIVFIIILYTMISWLINRNYRTRPLFNILSDIPSGLTAAGVPMINTSVISIVLKRIPAAITVILIEHIAIAKTFGRINNYIIDPSQEMVAIGITNIFGPFIGGFPATGSFSRTAIKSKVGVRTPFAGVITAVEVLLAIYALPAVFYYIPFSVLSAVIIYSVLNMVAPPSTIVQMWRISPLEVPIFFTGIIVIIFSSIENGIYATVGISFLILIFRLIKPKGRFLGKVKVHMATSYSILRGKTQNNTPLCCDTASSITELSGEVETRNIFLPLDYSDGANPEIQIQPPQPGIFIYRFSENLSYLNASHYFDQLTSYIFANTRRSDRNFYARPGDRPWNDHIQKKDSNSDIQKPILKSIILDFSAVNYIDFTSVQQLIDTRKQLDSYASPDPVDWYFCCVNNGWTKRALIAAGFDYDFAKSRNPQNRKKIFGIAQIRSRNDHTLGNTNDVNNLMVKSNNELCKESNVDVQSTRNPSMAMVSGFNSPCFHADIMTAWLSADMNVPELVEQKEA